MPWKICISKESQMFQRSENIQVTWFAKLISPIDYIRWNKPRALYGFDIRWWYSVIDILIITA